MSPRCFKLCDRCVGRRSFGAAHWRRTDLNLFRGMSLLEVMQLAGKERQDWAKRCKQEVRADIDDP